MVKALAARAECVIGPKWQGLALPDRPADSEAGGSGAAAAEWPGPVRYGVSAHRAHEFNEEFIQIFHPFTIFFTTFITIFFRHDFQYDLRLSRRAAASDSGSGE